MTELRFAILGCARICRRGMIAGITQSGLTRLVGIASTQPAKAAAWAEEFAIPKAYGSYDEVLQDPEVDAVYIPLPNELHRPWTIKAAEAGKHVLCEKPLALDVAEAEEMIAVCRRRGVLLMEAFMWRHHPRVVHASRMLADGLLGELKLVKMDFSFHIAAGDWRLDPQRGGGALFDLGCYGINAARLFTGAEPIEIHARGQLDPTGVDMTAAFQLRFPGGVSALLDCSFECPYRNRIEIVGTQLALELPEGVLPPAAPSLIVHKGGSSETIEFPSSNQYTEQVRHFAASVAAGRLLPPADDGLANMRVLQAVKEQVWQGGRS